MSQFDQELFFALNQHEAEHRAQEPSFSTTVLTSYAVSSDPDGVITANPPIGRILGHDPLNETIHSSTELMVDIHCPIEQIFDVLDAADTGFDISAVSVTSDRNSLKLITRCFLLQDFDYHLQRNKFCIDVERVEDMILLRRKNVRDDQVEGFGVPFENLMISEETRVVGKTYRVCNMQLAGRTYLVRGIVECVDDSNNSVEIKSKKLKKRKGARGGYYPLADEAFYREVWSQMVFTDTRTLVLGGLDMIDDRQAILRQVSRESIAQVVAKGRIEEAFIFAKLESLMAWLCENLLDGEKAELSYAPAVDVNTIRLKK